MAKVQFTAVYDWLARREELSAGEKLLIAHVLRFGRSGCFKSNNTLAHDLGMDRVTVIRTIKCLIDKQWIAPLYETRRDRILFVNERMIEDMPLLDKILGCGKPVKSSVKSAVPGSGALQQVSGALQQVSGDAPLAFNKTSKDLSYIDERLRKEVDFLASSMKEKIGRLSESQFEDRRQRQIMQLENMK